MILTLVLTSEEAEDLMFACKLRAVQREVPLDSKALMIRIRQAIEAEAIVQCKWDPAIQRWPVGNDIRVTVTPRNRW